MLYQSAYHQSSDNAISIYSIFGEQYFFNDSIWNWISLIKETAIVSKTAFNFLCWQIGLFPRNLKSEKREYLRIGLRMYMYIHRLSAEQSEQCPIAIWITRRMLSQRIVMGSFCFVNVRNGHRELFRAISHKRMIIVSSERLNYSWPSDDRNTI